MALTMTTEVGNAGPDDYSGFTRRCETIQATTVSLAITGLDWSGGKLNPTGHSPKSGVLSGCGCSHFPCLR